MSRLVLAAQVTFLCFLSVNFADANPGGPPTGRTGAPGELTCINGCHSSFSLNSGDGSLSLSNVPATYEFGQSYAIDISLSVFPRKTCPIPTRIKN